MSVTLAPELAEAIQESADRQGPSFDAHDLLGLPAPHPEKSLAREMKYIAAALQPFG